MPAAGARVRAPSREELRRRIEGVIERKGGIEILQLSGGEPTLHPEFLELLDWALRHPRIDYVLLNTNGVRLAQDEGFFEGLRSVHRPGRLQLYLQFDGPQEAGQRELRGADLREVRRRVLERCEAVPIPVTLAMTVTRANLAHVWEAIEYGLGWRQVRGVSFQPAFLSGRGWTTGSERLNTADIVLAAVAQSGGRLRLEDFTPLGLFLRALP